MAITVFVVDDHALVRSGLVQVINLESDLTAIGDAPGSSETLDRIQALKPRVVVIDLEMPGIRGADFLHFLKQRLPSTRTLVCTMHDSHGYVAEALRRGADGYVLKSSRSTLFVDAIRQVAAGHGFIDPALQTDLIRLVQRRDRQVTDELTAQELDILRGAAEGLSNHEIAQRTGQAMETVKLRFRRVFHKLGASDRASAVAQALRRQLIR
jgi:DNA-binding NarL/FixJ family response regulator